MNNIIHSDLACELSQKYSSFTNSNALKTTTKGVIYTKEQKDSILISRVKVLNEEGKKEAGLDVGSYVTLIFDDCTKMCDTEENELSTVISDEIQMLLPQNTQRLLICGLGNQNMTTDSIGVKTVQKATVTRHIKTKYKDIYAKARSISAITPGVLAQTGIESADVVSAVSSKTSPDVIITIDSICTKSQSRLCKTIQITDTGVSPGSGVDNRRPKIDSHSTDAKVISIGFPTVINSATLIYELLDETSTKENNDIERRLNNNVSYYVTINEIDEITEKISTIIANAIDIVSGVI